MEVSGLEEGCEYAIVLSSTSDEDIKSELDGDGTYTSRIEGLTPEWEYKLSLIQYDSVIGEITHFEVKLQTLKHSYQEPIPPPYEPEPEPEPTPDISITDAEIVGLNKVRLNFTYSDLPAGGSVKLDIVFGDMSTDTVVLTSEDIARGYTDITAESSATLTVTPTVTKVHNGDEAKTVCRAYTHTFSETFKATAMVGLYDQTVTFYPIGITQGANLIRYTTSLDPGNEETMWLEEAARIWYSTEDVITYTMYMSNDAGDVLSNAISITVDTTVAIPLIDYHMNYPNPGDLGVTYNDDGTINIYINTNFESDDDSVYYTITLGGIQYASRDKVARIEHIPDESYPLIYDVCIDIDGVRYSIFNTTPSGMANDSYMYYDSSLTDKVLSLRLSGSTYPDTSYIRLVSSTGEEIVLTESDFVYDSEYDNYDVTVEFNEYAEEVTIYLMANPYHLGLSDVDDYVGNIRKMYELTISQL